MKEWGMNSCFQCCQVNSRCNTRRLTIANASVQAKEKHENSLLIREGETDGEGETLYTCIKPEHDLIFFRSPPSGSPGDGLGMLSSVFSERKQ